MTFSIFRNRGALLFLLAAALPLAGCLTVRTPVTKHAPSAAGLLTASQEELVARINTDAGKLQSLQATVDLDASVGGEKTGAVTDYTEIRGYVLMRKPSMLRMIGLLPVVRNKAFDMVSDGDAFRLWIPAHNKFVTGKDAISEKTKILVADPPAPSTPESAQTAKLENLRPQHIYDALFIREIDPATEIAVVQAGIELIPDPKGHRIAEQPDYELLVLKQSPQKDGAKGWYLSRKIIITRSDLLPHRQIIYDEKNHIVTDVAYEKFSEEGGINFPHQINIWRPQEEYRVVLNILKLQLNLPLTNDQFQLETPSGANIIELGANNRKQPRKKEERGGGGAGN